MATNDYKFDDDDFEINEEDLILPKTSSQMTEGEKLQKLKRGFDSSTRALLQDCLFRVAYDNNGKGTLQILCPNDVVRQRLARKKHKTLNIIYSCWSDVKQFSLCLQQPDGRLHVQTLNRSNEILTDLYENYFTTGNSH